MELEEIRHPFMRIRALYDDEVVMESDILFGREVDTEERKDALETIVIRNAFITDVIDAIKMGMLTTSLEDIDGMGISSYMPGILSFMYEIVYGYHEICSDRMDYETLHTVGLVSPAIIDGYVEVTDYLEVMVDSVLYKVKSIIITEKVYEKLENEFYIFSEAVDSAYCRHYDESNPASFAVDLIKNHFVGKKLKDFVISYTIGEDLIVG